MADVAVDTPIEADELDEAQPWVPEDSFAARLRVLRYAMGRLSVEDIADRCGFKTPTWSTWENGVQPRGMAEVVATISTVTGVDRDWLMWGSKSRCHSHLGLVEPVAGQMELALGLDVPELRAS